MSDKLDNAEFWLPSEFLTEEDIVMDSYGVLGSSRLHLTPELSNKYGSSFTPSTGSISPVDSTETLSDEGDSLGRELTQLLTLLRANRITHSNQNHQDFGLPGSELSTFNGLKRGSGQCIIPSFGNPNGPFQLPSHATAPGCGKDDAWELIYKAAAGQVAKNNGGCGVAFPRNPGHLGHHAHIYHNHLTRGENLVEQELWNALEKNRLIFEQSYLKRAFACATPEVRQKNQQFRPDSGAKSGYGFGPGYRIGGVKTVKDERVGTGVFLPRRYGAGSDDFSGTVHPGNKTGYDRTKGNPAVNNRNNPQNRFIGDVVHENEAFEVARRAALLARAAASNNEAFLPQEWTY